MTDITKELAEVRLTKVARVGHTQFGIGVPERMVIEAAQRAAEHNKGEADDEFVAELNHIIQSNAERAAFLDAHPAVSAELAQLIEENERLTAALASYRSQAEGDGQSRDEFEAWYVADLNRIDVTAQQIKTMRQGNEYRFAGSDPVFFNRLWRCWTAASLPSPNGEKQR